MTAAAISYRLHGRRSGRGWIARCPAHPDRSPSLSIAEGDDGRTLLKCWAGCPVSAVLNAAGLRWQDIMPASPRDRHPAEGLSRETKKAIAAAQDSLRRHPAGSLFRELPLRVVISDAERIGTVIARALALAIDGELVQVAQDCEEPNAA